MPLADERISSRHASVTFDGARWTVEDKDSRNGTFVDGERLKGKASFDEPRVVRVGRSLFLPMLDVRRYVDASVERKGGAVIGPTTRLAWAEIERAARFGEVLLLSGESGAGKELAARAFHSLGPRAAGPFIAVNCAAIPQGLAERLLFGARRGAYSGATADSEGYVQAADGGTLFLDEVADLDAQVQAKLLRTLETKEVLPLGASKPRAVDVRVCSATRDLRAEVASGRFREDLYFRIGQPEVRLPPLRERRDELPWLLASELDALSINCTLVEACLLRPWPGNVRELLSEVRRVASRARAAGRSSVAAEDLSPTAGVDFVRNEGAGSASPALPEPEVIERALQEHKGNVTRAAQALGMHRNQLRRWLAKRGSPGTVASTDGEDHD
jgi:transcriptional regulator with PAS, ATPase and Fis domain